MRHSVKRFGEIQKYTVYDNSMVDAARYFIDESDGLVKPERPSVKPCYLA